MDLSLSHPYMSRNESPFDKQSSIISQCIYHLFKSENVVDRPTSCQMCKPATPHQVKEHSL